MKIIQASELRKIHTRFVIAIGFVLSSADQFNEFLGRTYTSDSDSGKALVGARYLK